MPEKEGNYYSEPVQEIMGSIPSWITRWGVTVIAGIFALIVIGCCIIRYPQTLTSSITLTSENPPSDLASRYDGLLDTVCVVNGQKVRNGDLVALLSTPADYGDIMAVRDLLDSLSSRERDALPDAVSSPSLYENYRLGDLQSSWSELVRSCRAYMNWSEIDQSGHQKRLVEEQIGKNREYYGDLLVQKAVLEQDMRYELAGLERDSLLMVRGAVSRAEYETSLKNWISKKGSLASFEATLTSTQLSILQLRQQLTELEIQRQNEETEHLRGIMQQASQLKAQVAQWLEQYAVISPADGTVSLQKVWSRGQHVLVGDVIASVVPDNGDRVIGRLQVPSSGFGKVEEGQTVNVRLNGFPYMEFGVLKGVVESIPAVPQTVTTAEGNSIVYTVEVSFPDSLVTTYGKELPMVQQMDGTAEIITRDRRLIGQFIDPVLSLFKNR